MGLIKSGEKFDDRVDSEPVPQCLDDKSADLTSRNPASELLQRVLVDRDRDPLRRHGADHIIRMIICTLQLRRRVRRTACMERADRRVFACAGVTRNVHRSVFVSRPCVYVSKNDAMTPENVQPHEQLLARAVSLVAMLLAAVFISSTHLEAQPWLLA